MKKEQVTRSFRIADSVLKQKADELIVLIDRDLTEFTDRGYNPTKKTELTTARNRVDSFPSDEELEAQCQIQGIRQCFDQSTKRCRACAHCQDHEAHRREIPYRTFR